MGRFFLKFSRGFCHLGPRMFQNQWQNKNKKNNPMSPAKFLLRTSPWVDCFCFLEVFATSSSSQSRSQPRLPDRSPPPPRSPDPNREFQIPVGTAGPQRRIPDRSGHCRTSTATSRSQWALPDLNRDFQIAVGTAGS